MVRLHPPVTDAIDAWIATQPDPKPSRPEAIRVALRDWLTGMGLLTKAEPDQATVATKIEALEIRIAEIPEHSEPSPQAGMDQMRKGFAESELAKLKNMQTEESGE